MIVRIEQVAFLMYECNTLGYSSTSLVRHIENDGMLKGEA